VRAGEGGAGGAGRKGAEFRGAHQPPVKPRGRGARAKDFVMRPPFLCLKADPFWRASDVGSTAANQGLLD